MEPEAKYTLVGTVVLVLAVLLVAAVLWLRSTGQGEDAHVYKIYFERQSLEGLEVRSDVLMRGIRVGSVTDFQFSMRRPGAVEVLISVAPQTPVRTSTLAVVDRHLVTGIASVRLVNPTEEAPLLEKPPPGEPYPVIAEGESALAQVSETVNELARRTAETLDRVNKALSDENQKAIAETLGSIRRIAQQAEKTLATLDRTAASVGGAADEVRTLTRSVGGDARKLAARYDALGTQAAQSLEEISGSVRRLSADTGRLAQSAESLLTTGDVELRTTAQALRDAANALGEAARGLGDPGSAIFGPPPGAYGPGEAPQ